jgi:hypothetical protein
MVVLLGAVVGGVVVAGLLAVAGVLAFAPEPEAAHGTEPVRVELTSLDCMDVIPDSAFETLGWVGGAAREHAGRCEKLGDDGILTVGDLPVIASRAERPKAAEKLYDERCSTLFDVPGATPDLDADWLPEGATACVRLLPSGKDAGIAELFLLTDGDEVVQIRMEALSPTPEAKVKAGFLELVEAADRHW